MEKDRKEKTCIILKLVRMGFKSAKQRKYVMSVMKRNALFVNENKYIKNDISEREFKDKFGEIQKRFKGY